jgi:hypothetical protein
MTAGDTIDQHPTAFPPSVLREYALLADGERGALVGPHGEFAWMCAPHWDSDAVFAELIGGGGTYAVTPQDARHVWGGYYEQGSLIWRNRWVCHDSVIECRDALAFPGDPRRAVVRRRITARTGTARVTVLLDPRARFGRETNHSLQHSGGGWTGRTGTLRWRWSGADAARPGAGDGSDEVLRLELSLCVGEHHDLVLEIAEHSLPDRPPDPDTAWAATRHCWSSAMPELDHTLAPRDARHACAVLSGLTSVGGGMAAAATMSLPERADAGRNYDYRYAWIRDQCYAGMAAAAAGHDDLLDKAVGFVSARLLQDGPTLKPAYTVTGGAVPDERRLDLPGYPGGTDKIGNWVNQQFQLDAFGETLQLLAAAGRHDRLDTEGRRALHAAVSAIRDRWTDPDAGIWELDDQRFAP